MPVKNPKIQSIELILADKLKIAGIQQLDPNSPSPTRVLCLHGWLDNANSFMPMLPFLPDMHLVAVDLPGHGHSSHISGAYSVLDTTLRCLHIADALGWESFHVVGHSLGGSLALMLAVTAPSRIESCTAIESAGPLTEASDRFVERIRKAADDRMHPERYTSRTFANPEAAVAARLRAAKMDKLSAELIIRRQIQAVDAGFQWRFDPALRNTSVSYLMEQQVEKALSSITCRVQVVLARDGFVIPREESAARLGCIPNIDITELPGFHHLHMDTPEPVAAAINRFLGTQPALGG